MQIRSCPYAVQIMYESSFPFPVISLQQLQIFYKFTKLCSLPHLLLLMLFLLLLTQKSSERPGSCTCSPLMYSLYLFTALFHLLQMTQLEVETKPWLDNITKCAKLSGLTIPVIFCVIARSFPLIVLYLALSQFILDLTHLFHLQSMLMKDSSSC